VPGYSTVLPNIDEARLEAVHALIVGQIADLDASLQLSPISFPAGTAVAGLVVIGDPESLPSQAEAPFLICVTGGTSVDTVDLETELRYVGVPSTVSSFRLTLHTTVRVYIHPRTFPAADSSISSIQSQAELRERLRSRLCDFIRSDVFQSGSGVDIALGSREYATAPGYDAYTQVRVAEIRKGLFDKSFAGLVSVFGAELLVTGLVE